MGRRSESEDDYEFRKSKRKKKKRSRSRSDDSSSSRYSSKHKKYKKVKHKKHSRSRSRDRSSRKSRSRSASRSRDRLPSRNRDRHSRRRSHSGSRRSRSHSRSRRSRSHSRSRWSRSHSRSRRSRSHSRSRRSRSHSRSRRSRSHSSSRNRRSRSRDKGRQTSGHSDISQQIPGFHDMTAGEQVNARMKLALRAAAAADEKIREQLTGVPCVEDVRSFGKAVAKIEKDNFTPTTFKSSRTEKIKVEPKVVSYSTHEHAMFGAGTFDIKMEPTKLIYVEPESYAHPNLYCNLDEKMDRWMQKLSSMRRKRMEGDAF